jgi:hypothetical protein
MIMWMIVRNILDLLERLDNSALGDQNQAQMVER